MSVTFLTLSTSQYIVRNSLADDGQMGNALQNGFINITTTRVKSEYCTDQHLSYTGFPFKHKKLDITK